MELRDAVVVVTGASSGIGWSTAWAFAREGSTIVAAARREARLTELVGRIEKQGGRALAVTCDVGDAAQAESMARKVKGTFGRCDVLVNNAGVPQGGSFLDLSVQDIERIIRVNCLGVMYCTKAFLPSMVEAGHGHVVNVASLAGRFAMPGSGVYAATKHAVVAFSESLHYEVEARGLRVTAVNPGFVTTEGFPHRDPLEARMAMKPEVVAGLIVRTVRTGKAPEVSIPRWLSAFQAFRVLTPPIYRFGLRQATRTRVQREAGDRAAARPTS